MPDSKKKPSDDKALTKKEDQQLEKVLKETAPPEVAEFFEGAPKEVKRSFMGMFRSTFSAKTPASMIFEKITAKHIDKAIDQIRQNEENDYKIRSSNRYFYAFFSLLIIGFLVFLILAFKEDNPELLSHILGVLGGLIAGFIGGMGYGTYRKSSK